jgi:hypothetical protein
MAHDLVADLFRSLSPEEFESMLCPRHGFKALTCPACAEDVAALLKKGAEDAGIAQPRPMLVPPRGF